MKHDTRLLAGLYGPAQSKLEATLALHMRAAGLRPESEFRFHKLRRWRFDFAFPDRKIGIECEGGTWSNGRHVRGLGFEKDAEKYNTAAIDGWLVLRFTGRMIKSGKALMQIEQALQSGKQGRPATLDGPSHNPPRRGLISYEATDEQL